MDSLVIYFILPALMLMALVTCAPKVLGAVVSKRKCNMILDMTVYGSGLVFFVSCLGIIGYKLVTFAVV